MSIPPTIATIADKAGVAKSTVSLALRNSPKVKEGKRLIVQRIARELGYRPNPLVTAQMARIRQTKKLKSITSIAFFSTLIDEIQHKRLRWTIMGQFYKGAKDRAEELGFNFELCEFDRAYYSDERIQQILNSRKIDGLVLAPLKLSSSKINLDWSQFAMSAIGYYTAFGNINRVFYDNFNCMRRVMRLLEDRGYKRIGFVTNTETEARAGHFWSGSFLDYQSRNISCENHVPLLRQDTQESQYTEAHFERVHSWYLEQKPDAIISFLDNTLRFLESKGYESYKDFGYIALTWTKEMGNTSGYYQSLEKVGAAAVDMVAERIYRNERGVPNYPTTTLLTGEFIEGRTLRPSQ